MLLIMKKIFYTHVLILLTLFCSCDLLDIKPVNSMLPVSVEDFESVLLGGYPRSDFFINTVWLRITCMRI